MPSLPGDMRAAFYGAARRLETWSITLRPEQLGLIEGLRAAIAVSVMVAASFALNQPILAWAAFGAFWTCLSDPGGSGPERFPTLGRFAAMGSLMAGLMSFCGGFGVWVSALLLFAGVMLCGCIRLSKRVANQVSVLSTVVAVVAIDFPRDPLQAAALAGIFLTGCLFAILLCAVWRIHPYAQGRRAVSAVYRELAFHAAEAAGHFQGRDGSDPAQARQRAAVRDSIERARAVLDRTVAGRNDRDARAWLQSALECADRIFAGLVALDHDRSAGRAAAEWRSEMLSVMQGALAEIERQVLLPVPDWSCLRPVSDWLAGKKEGEDGLEQRVAGQWTIAFADFESGAAPAGITGAPASSDRTFRPVLRHALRVAVTVGLVRMVTLTLHLPYGYWATVAVVVVMQPEMAATLPRMLERIIGSSVGGVAAALIYAALPSPDLLLIAIFPIAAITIAVRSVNYSLFVTFLTALFVLVTELLTPSTGAAVVAEARVYNNLIGAVLAMAGTMLLWPDPHLEPFITAVEAAIQANLGYAEAIVRSVRADGTAADSGRREAGMTSTAAEVSLRRLLLQGRGRRVGSDLAGPLLAELRRLTGMATAACLSGDAGMIATIEEQDRRCREMAESWRAAVSGPR